MDLDTQTVTAFVVGIVLGFILLSIVIPVLNRRQRASSRASTESYEQTIIDLRQEQAEDRETNRRLRHQLAVSTPEHLEVTRAELHLAAEQLTRLRAELHQSAEDLAERDRSLREARLAIQEIRIQLEAGDAQGDAPGFDDLPPALADGSVGDG